MNSSDLQTSFHGADTSIGGGGGGGTTPSANTSCSEALNTSTIQALSSAAAAAQLGAVTSSILGGSGGAAAGNLGSKGVGGSGGDLNAQDATEGILRRERYVNRKCLLAFSKYLFSNFYYCISVVNHWDFVLHFCFFFLLSILCISCKI